MMYQNWKKSQEHVCGILFPKSQLDEQRVSMRNANDTDGYAYEQTGRHTNTSIARSVSLYWCDNNTLIGLFYKNLIESKIETKIKT